jgi:hypothetical protein
MYPPVRALISRALAATRLRVSPSARNFWYPGERLSAPEKVHQLWFSYSAKRRASQLVRSRRSRSVKWSCSGTGIPTSVAYVNSARKARWRSRREAGKWAGERISEPPARAICTWLAETRFASTPSGCPSIGIRFMVSGKCR